MEDVAFNKSMSDKSWWIIYPVNDEKVCIESIKNGLLTKKDWQFYCLHQEQDF